MARVRSRFVNEGWVQEQPNGTINGSNVTFTLAYTPDDSKNLLLTQDGLVQIQGTDYTISGATITMTAAPALGQHLFAVYAKKF